ncbi:MAG: hypothetical protein ACI97A_004011, partial [Planctomycetota bacterium]
RVGLPVIKPTFKSLIDDESESHNKRYWRLHEHVRSMKLRVLSSSGKVMYWAWCSTNLKLEADGLRAYSRLTVPVGKSTIVLEDDGKELYRLDVVGKSGKWSDVNLY